MGQARRAKSARVLPKTLGAEESMNEKWTMEEMGNCIKEKYICTLSSIARSKGFDTSKNSYRLSSSVCTEPDRFNTRFHSNNRVFRRFNSIAIRHLVEHSPYSSRRVARMPGISGGAIVRTTPQSSSCCRNYHNLVTGNGMSHTVGLAIYQRHLTISLSGRKKHAA